MDDVRAAPEGGLRPMLLRDRVAVTLGMRLAVDEPGHAVITMVVRDDMLNGFDVMHGGLIFSLADTAFAVACNETDEVTLAAGAEISFLRPVRVGQELTATALRRTRAGRSGIYDVQVVDEAGHVVAEFRGRSRTTRLPGPVPGTGTP
ncbi:hydroxyphenylacetyl-CoA thioesterase PaaI [Microterricola pindariensis]|uniref:Phenylacetic acid degradation protein PaaD n=1 Tax=Microterricola pindariensis TaxID=478010 RepID=A0ABX5AWP7_9MICO|nr:hydroxyphenylacetyl-CoA thioesterase PaaI [Microterricola pindariensis]PPL18814.1 phenylacetic acid degradation protein PaaD [Microterricola pindariensis]